MAFRGFNTSIKLKLTATTVIWIRRKHIELRTTGPVDNFAINDYINFSNFRSMVK